MTSSLALKSLFSRVVRRVSGRGHHHSPFTIHLSPRSGFTLIEILVASMLLGMLMSILTMVFNSSAIAWRTGRASNAKMSSARKQLAYAQKLADNALPRITADGETGRIVSAWNFKNNKQSVRDRAVEPSSKMPESWAWANWFNNAGPQSWNKQFQSHDGDDAPSPWAGVNDITSMEVQGGHSYLVGVCSWGPDGKENTKDDIDTMPVTVE
jgi:prepilin-type N-terminal cleavage/methylation domain-containing protein